MFRPGASAPARRQNEDEKGCKTCHAHLIYNPDLPGRLRRELLHAEGGGLGPYRVKVGASTCEGGKRAFHYPGFGFQKLLQAKP